MTRDAVREIDHRPLWRGSSASRRPSPKKFNPMTTLMIAIPGAAAYHQYWRPLSAPCLIIAPHSGVGGTAPRPMKLNPAVSTIAAPTSNVALTIIGASVDGRMCLNRIRPRPAPMDSAAVMNSLARIARTCPRISLAYSGQMTMATARRALLSPGPPRAAVIAIARVIEGEEREAAAGGRIEFF